MYARDTKVDPSRSREEIERLLFKRKASKVGVATDNAVGVATVAFQIGKAAVSFQVKLPHRDEFKQLRHGWTRTESAIDETHQKAIRQRWRSVLMVLKGKFAAIDAGVETFEQAFFYHLHVPSGGTVGEHVISRYQQAMNDPKKPLLGTGS